MTDKKGPLGQEVIWITVPRKNIQGFIPNSQKHIHINGEAIYGRFKTQLNIPTAFNIQIPTSSVTFSTLFPRTVYAFLVALSQKAEALNLADTFAIKLRDDQYQRRLTVLIEEGARTTHALNILNMPNFTLNDLQNVLHQSIRMIEGELVSTSRPSEISEAIPVDYLRFAWASRATFGRERGAMTPPRSLLREASTLPGG